MATTPPRSIRRSGAKRAVAVTSSSAAAKSNGSCRDEHDIHKQKGGHDSREDFYRLPEATAMTNPAKQLAGLELQGGWRVLNAVELGDDHSGGYFSQGYVVEQRGSGRRGFLKALDYTRAMQDPDP